MKVHYDEGIAAHIDPEPCVGIREDVSEASVGEHAGQPLSRESYEVPDADTVEYVEGNTVARVIASVRSIRRGRRPWHVWKFLAREPGDLRVGHIFLGRDGPQREGEEP